jgi:hypothetical protein
MKLSAGIAPAIGVLFSFVLAAAAQGAAQLSDGFPLERGTYWVYDCRTTRKDFNSLPVQKSLSWKMEILETMRQNDLVIALLRGHLDHLPGASEPKRGDYPIVAVRNSEYYLVAPPQSQDLLQGLKKTQTDWASLVHGKGPLITGRGLPTEQAAEENSAPHRPGFDSWFVQNARRLKLKGLKTNVSLGSVEQYSLVYGLNKSEKKVDFVPGVGIT